MLIIKNYLDLNLIQFGTTFQFSILKNQAIAA